MNKIRKITLTVIGGILAFLGLLFILVPGPAFLFLPIGLAILSLEYDWARDYLKRCQRWMRKGAKQLDSLLLKWRHR